jgi:hypothetical protein
MVSCTQNPVAMENPENSSSIEETLDVGGATYRFPDDTPVQWLRPFPDMAKPVSGFLHLQNQNLYISVRHRNAFSYLRCDIQDPSLTSPFHDWYWDYVSRDLDTTERNTPNHDYLVINETLSTTQETDTFVVVVNGDKLQAVSTYIDPNWGMYETRPNDPKRILWEHTLPSDHYGDFCYYNHKICYLSKEYDTGNQYKEVRLNVLDADTGERIINWYPPQDVLNDYGDPIFTELRFVNQYKNLYIMYHKPEFPNYVGSFPIYAFDMNTNRLAWVSETYNCDCSGGYELNGKLYFLDDQVDIIKRTSNYCLYGIDIKTGEKTPPLYLPSGLGSSFLRGVTEKHFLVSSKYSNYFASVHQEDMTLSWIYDHITGFSQPQEDGTIFLVKEDRYIQKVNISDGTIEQEWDIQALTNPRLSLYRNVNTTKYDLANPEDVEEYYSWGRNQLVVSKEGLLCAIYKEKLGYYSLKTDARSTYTEPEDLQFSVYGIITIDVSKPIESSNETES